MQLIVKEKYQFKEKCQLCMVPYVSAEKMFTRRQNRLQKDEVLRLPKMFIADHRESPSVFPLWCEICKI